MYTRSCGHTPSFCVPGSVKLQTENSTGSRAVGSGWEEGMVSSFGNWPLYPTAQNSRGLSSLTVQGLRQGQGRTPRGHGEGRDNLFPKFVSEAWRECGEEGFAPELASTCCLLPSLEPLLKKESHGNLDESEMRRPRVLAQDPQERGPLPQTVPFG